MIDIRNPIFAHHLPKLLNGSLLVNCTPATYSIASHNHKESSPPCIKKPKHWGRCKELSTLYVMERNREKAMLVTRQFMQQPRPKFGDLNLSPENQKPRVYLVTSLSWETFLGLHSFYNARQLGTLLWRSQPPTHRKINLQIDSCYMPFKCSEADTNLY